MYIYIYVRRGSWQRDRANREKIGEVTLQWSINAVAHALTRTANISKQARRGMGSAIRRHQRNAAVMQLPSDLLGTITNLPWTRINYERCTALHQITPSTSSFRFHPPFPNHAPFPPFSLLLPLDASWYIIEILYSMSVWYSGLYIYFFEKKEN